MPTFTQVLSVPLISLIALSQSAEAAGKKPTTDPAPNPPPTCGVTPPAGSTPTPVRKVILRPVGTKTFPLPNGSEADLSHELNTMFRTSAAASSSFAPVEGSGAGVEDATCDQHVEIRAELTTLELKLLELGLTIGYTPTKVNSTITNLNGTAKVEIGSIAFDFSLWNCVGSRCTALEASTSTHKTTHVDLQLGVDFGLVHTGADLVYNSSLGNTLRAILEDGVRKLSASPRVAELPWYAVVREAMPEAGVFIFDAGMQSRIQANQNFAVYASTPATGACHVYKTIAYGHTSRVDAISSTAIVDQVLDSRPIQEGDIVMIRAGGK